MRSLFAFSAPSPVRILWLGCLAIFFCLASVAYAEDVPAEATVRATVFPASNWTQEKTYADKIAHKLGFGFLNLTAGWTALFFEPVHAKNFFSGLGTGVLYTVTNTAGGILHAATFPIPLDIPLPYGGISYEYDR